MLFICYFKTGLYVSKQYCFSCAYVNIFMFLHVCVGTCSVSFCVRKMPAHEKIILKLLFTKLCVMVRTLWRNFESWWIHKVSKLICSFIYSLGESKLKLWKKKKKTNCLIIKRHKVKSKNVNLTRNNSKPEPGKMQMRKQSDQNKQKKN